MKDKSQIDRENLFRQRQNARLAALKSNPPRVQPDVPIEIDPDTGLPYGLSDLIDMGTYS